MLITIPREQLQKNINLEKNWYGAIFKKIEGRKDAKNASTTNFFAFFDLECDNREMEVFIAKSSDLRGFQTLAEALTGNKVEVKNGVVQEDIDFDPEKYYGQKIKVSIDNDQYLGRLISKIQLGGFLPYETDTSQLAFGV